jgi:hypothetical protein
MHARYLAVERLRASKDAKEDQRTFIEKRKPRW